MRVKSEEKRQTILDIAKEAFTEQGFNQTSMSTIAKMVGGSKATLYNYFNSKEEIFAAVMEDSATQDIASAFDSLNAEGNCKEELIRFGNNYLKSILTPEIVALRKMALSEAFRSDIGRHFYTNGPQRGQRSVAHFLDTCVQRGELLPCDTRLASAQLIALIEAEVLTPYELCAIDRPEDTEIHTVTERAVNAFLTLYGTRS